MSWKRMRRMVTGAMVSGLLAAPAASAGTFKEALDKGKVDYDVRYRYARINESGFVETAVASTARLRLGYETGKFWGFQVYAGFHGTVTVGKDDYNDTANGKTQFPVEADPEDAGFNQAHLSFVGVDRLLIRGGRQRIALDNQRFVGPVGWRQLEQTFDALSGEWNAERLRLYYAHLKRANRVVGEHHPVEDLSRSNMDSDLLQAGWAFGSADLVGYMHTIEFEDATAPSPIGPADSHRNLGIRLSGEWEFSRNATLAYTGEYAEQTDQGSGAPTIDARYQLAELGFKGKKWGLLLGHEVLGGDGSYGFQTPLATLHAFNGWADRFVVTPVDGLQDAYARLTGDLFGFDFSAIYHEFGADNGGADYGREIDLQALKKFRSGWAIGLKYADYEEQGFSVDADKLWFWISLES